MHTTQTGETARKYREKHTDRGSELHTREKTHDSEQISMHNYTETCPRERSSVSARERMKSKMNIKRTLLYRRTYPEKRCTSVVEKKGKGYVHRISRKAKKKKRASTNTVKQVHILIYADKQ